MNLMFQPQFALQVTLGTKRQTVRPTRRRPLKPGQILSLRVWTGKPYRSKQSEIAKAEVTSVEPVFLQEKKLILGLVVRNTDYAEQFAIADGFESYETLCWWFSHTHGLPFVGEVIYFKISP